MYNYKENRSLRASVSAIALALSSVASSAQMLEEVVVTATKRAESIQDVPISISAFSGNFMQDSGINDLQDLGAYAPNLNLSKAGNVANQRIAIRGVGSVGNSAIEPSVAVFIDGVYYPRPGSVVGKLHDVAAVEVLRGPQGTLFGRNASMGALNIRSNAPSHDFEAEVHALAGSFSRREAGGMVNGSLGDKVAGRLSLQRSERDGYGRSSFDGADIGGFEDDSIRGSLMIDVSDRLTATLRADWKSIENNGTLIEVLPDSVLPAYLNAIAFVLDPDQNDAEPGPLPDVADAFDYRVHQKHGDRATDSQGGLSAELVWAGDNFDVKSITAVRNWQNDTHEDLVRLPADILRRDTAYEADTVSQEFQLISNLDGPFQYVAGAFFYHEEYSTDQGFDFGADFCRPVVYNVVLSRTNAAAVATLAADQCAAGAQRKAIVSAFEHEVDSMAVFAQGSYDISAELTATAGLRWTRDEKSGSFFSRNNNPIAGPQSLPDNPFGLGLRADESTDLDFDDSMVTWTTNLRYTPNDDLMFFATASTGFKGGGFNSEGGPVALGDERTFDSEEVMNFELGMKATLLERLIVNATAFRTDIEQFQDRLFDGLGFNVVNAGELRQQGVEVDLQSQLTSRLFLAMGLSYLDSEFLDYPNGTNLPGFDASQPQDLSGTRNNFSPKYQGSLTLEWRDTLGDELEWFLRGEYQTVAEQSVSGQTDNNPASRQDAYSVMNLRTGISAVAGSWSVTGFVKNLTEEGYCQATFYQPLASAIGLTDPDTGNAMTRCAVAEPRSYGIEYRYRF